MFLSKQLSFSLGGIVFLCCLGCGGSTPKKDPNPKNGSQHNLPPLEQAHQILQKTATLARCRESVSLLNKHLDQDPAKKTLIAKLVPDKKTLTDIYGLNLNEIQYVSDPRFNTVDAYHLELCFRLRDVVHNLRWKSLPPLLRAEEAFQWTNRQVALHHSEEELLYPGFVLQRGSGSAEQRALLFLALLPHLDLAGCMIAVPEKGGSGNQYHLPGVLIEKDKTARGYLFDTRLGIPLPGPMGKGIATLEQVRKSPELLQALDVDERYTYDVTAEQMAKAQILLACPLSAITGRMHYLESVFNPGRQRNPQLKKTYHLAFDPKGMLEKFRKVTGEEIGVWNSPDEKNTPLRSLRNFLPTKEDGLANPAAAEALKQELWQWREVAMRMQDLQLFSDFHPSAQNQLMLFVAALMKKYILNPRGQLTRGNFETMTTRLVKIRDILRKQTVSVNDRAKLVREINDWRRKVRKICKDYGNKVRGAEQKYQMIWNRDYFLYQLTQPDVEEEELNADRKTILTDIVLDISIDALETEALYLLARVWLEKAERSQTQFEQNPTAVRRKQMQSAWINALDWCRKFVARYPLTPETLKSQVQEISRDIRYFKGNDIPLLNQYCQDIHQIACLQQDFAMGLVKDGQGEKAKALLKKQVEALGEFRENSGLKELLQKIEAEYRSLIQKELDLAKKIGVDLRKKQQQIEAAQKTLSRKVDIIRDTLETGGSLYWLEYAAAYRLKKLHSN